MTLATFSHFIGLDIGLGVPQRKRIITDPENWLFQVLAVGDLHPADIHFSYITSRDWLVFVFQVLAVGDLHPADIRYSYTISRHNVKSDFDWSNKVGPLSECNRACQGTLKLVSCAGVAPKMNQKVVLHWNQRVASWSCNFNTEYRYCLLRRTSSTLSTATPVMLLPT